MKLGIIGLPNVGKSTLYNALTMAGAHVANYPFCTIEPNIGTVPVPDPRIDHLRGMFSLEKTVHATIEFIDIAGLVKGASQGHGLGNQFLSHIRQTQAICHVVRCFEDKDIAHVSGAVNPEEDINTIKTELLLADLETVDRAFSKAEKQARSEPKAYTDSIDFYASIRNHLNDGLQAVSFHADPSHATLMEGLFLLTAKPVIYVANVDESGITTDNPHVEAVRKTAQSENARFIKICAKLEEEAMLFGEQEKQEFLNLSGIRISGLQNLVIQSYALLNYISFITFNEKEVRAWTLENGTTAREAAGRIHSDIERGFIRAETISYDELLLCGSWSHAREKGSLRIEGKEYRVQDGDVILFRFHV
ncbi:MAG: redox-regulated ATPase YchF [Clostridia bacterium]